MESLRAHEARAAGDVERDHDALTGMDPGDAGANLLHDAHRFVAENVTLAQERAEYLVQVQVGSADTGRRDPHDRVGRVFDLRIGDRVDADVTLAVPCHCLHLRSPDAPVGSTGHTRCGARVLPGMSDLAELRRKAAGCTA